MPVMCCGYVSPALTPPILGGPCDQLESQGKGVCVCVLTMQYIDSKLNMELINPIENVL